MSQTATSIYPQKVEPVVAAIDMKLEVVVIPVSDIDRAKEFYAGLGWRFDADFDSSMDIEASSSRRPVPGLFIAFRNDPAPGVTAFSQGIPHCLRYCGRPECAARSRD